MATISSIFNGVLPSGTSVSTSLYSVDTATTATSTVYEWRTANGDLFTFTGSFSYLGGPGALPFGSVTQVEFDHGDDGTIDMTIDFGFSKVIPTAPIFSSDAALLDFLFEGADTMSLVGGPDGNGGDTVFSADGPVSFGSNTSASDNLNIAGFGRFSADQYSEIQDGFVFAGDSATLLTSGIGITVTGDLYRLGAYNNGTAGSERVLTFGDDTSRDLSPSGASLHTLIGDLATTLASSSFFQLELGDDTLTGGDNLINLYGDIDVLSGNNMILNAGDDSLTASTDGGLLYGDVGFFDNNATDNQLMGGDDILDASASGVGLLLYGDVSNTGLASTVTGGNDTITGSSNADTIIGDASVPGFGTDVFGGNDSIEGGDGNDFIEGDVLFVSPGASGTITGGNDFISGGDGSDTINGNGGSDSIRGGEDGDSLSGGDGNDTISGGAGDDIMDGGFGIDTLDFTASHARIIVVLNGANTVLTSGNGSDEISNFENVIGSSLDDDIFGDQFDNVLDGRAGADLLDGDDGTDLVDYLASPEAVNVNLSTGVGASGHAAGDTLRGIENLAGTIFSDTLVGDAEGNNILGDFGDDVLRGRGGNDTLTGLDGEDEINGGNGRDSISALNDADTVRGQGEADTIQGGTGADQIFAGPGGDLVFGGNDPDNILGQGQADTIFGDAGDDTILGGSGNDLIEGGSGADDLSGNGNNDTLRGGDENDILRGAAGLDVLEGGSGNDTLNGGDGSDRHDGGSGNDTMNGGGADGARDFFVFSVGYDQDRVNAFDQVGNDVLELDDALWTGTLTEQQVIDTFGTLNTGGTILTLDFGNGDILEVQNSGGINAATLGADVDIV